MWLTATPGCAPRTGTTSRDCTSCRCCAGRPQRFAHSAALCARETNARVIISMSFPRYKIRCTSLTDSRYAFAQSASDVVRGHPRPLPDINSSAARGLRCVPKCHWAYVADVRASSQKQPQRWSRTAHNKSGGATPILWPCTTSDSSPPTPSSSISTGDIIHVASCNSVVANIARPQSDVPTAPLRYSASQTHALVGLDMSIICPLTSPALRCRTREDVPGSMPICPHGRSAPSNWLLIRQVAGSPGYAANAP